MGINIHDFFDLTKESFSDYIAKYEIELSHFMNEFEDNTESFFISMQLISVKNMREALLLNINELKSDDPDSEFVFNLLEKKLKTNHKISEYLETRKKQLQQLPEAKKETLPENVTEFFSHINNTWVSEVDILNFIDKITNNEVTKLELLSKDTEAFKVNYLVESVVYDEVYKKPLSESFTFLQNSILEKIELETNKKVESKNTTLIDDKSLYPSKIFRDRDSFKKFQNYIENHIIDFYTDYSYLKKRMELEAFIMRITDSEFVNFLSESNYITSKNYDEYLNNGKLKTLKKSFTANRENNFNNIFFK